MIKTKIIATIGPACSASDMIRAMIDNGVDVFRLNFSHGTLDDHDAFLEALNAARAAHTHTTAVIGDLCGPKIRTADIRPQGYVLKIDDEITITADAAGEHTPTHFGTNYPKFIDDIVVGHRVFIDDGAIALRVIEKHDDRIVCRVLAGGALYSRKGINLPDTEISSPSITERDWECVRWAVERKLEFLALSFVRTADEIHQLKDYLAAAGSDIKVIAKIEKPQAIDQIEAIVRASDVILVARGDLGVEMDLAEVPLIQKRITRLCRRFGTPVIVATQMLQSMIDAPVPTRAEVSDVANAIMDFTDSVMLSGETAIGKYPIEAAKAIRRIARVTEAWLDSANDIRPKIETADGLATTAAIARTVAHLVDDIAPQLVAAWSETGATARLLSKVRIDVPIAAFSSSDRVCKQMCLHYGVVPRRAPVPESFDAFTDAVDHMALERHWVRGGDRIVLVAGSPLSHSGNAIIVHNVPGP
ncbi:MAG: pyruvate kinase [Phycisphaerae bacterium]|nr:pyruvate kinase [Phycisphaerae bacterium]